MASEAAVPNQLITQPRKPWPEGDLQHATFKFILHQRLAQQCHALAGNGRLDRMTLVGEG